MIYETHGDVCRIGYLRLIACLADDNMPKTLDYMASLLHEITKQTTAEKTFNITGIIASMVNARNYITLAAGTGIIDRKQQTRGLAGIIYTRLGSSYYFHAVVEGGEVPSIDKIILLNPVEQAFFLHTLLYYDYPFLGEIILWALNQGRFNRTTAMNEIMENIYPVALEKSLSQADSKRRQLLRKEIEEARTFRETRMSFSSQAEWIRSRQYAKYRHIAPPRLEWLVDLGILNREGRGKFAISDRVQEVSTELMHALKQPIKKMEEEVFQSVFPYLWDWERADKDDIAHKLLQAYYKLEKTGVKKITLNMLKTLACYLLMEEGKITTPNTMHQVFNNLAMKYPDKVFLTPAPEEIVQMAGIEIT